MEYVLVFLLLLVLEVVYFKVASYYNIVDKPNERSSHSQITLRGGGIVFYFGCLIFFVLSDFKYPFFILGLTAVTVVSFVDDIYSLPNKVRLLVQLIGVILLFYQWDLFVFSWFWSGLALLISIGVINAYNFMDGINGITALYSLIVLTLLNIVNIDLHFVDSRLIVYVALSVVVFSYFNFRNRALAFAGDVGSVSMAFILLYLLGLVIIQSGSFLYILFLAVYGTDTVWTICSRMIKGENIFKAHRSHLYQYLSNEMKINKLVVAFLYATLQLLIGLAVIKIAVMDVRIQFIFSTIVLIFLTLMYWGIKKYLSKQYKI